jgi:hypothetical protein
MIRKLFCCALLFVAVLAVGCCGPLGCGPGCGSGMSCNDCDGSGFERQMIGGPLDGLRQFKRSLVCGGGCGETYIGEWISTPPDCEDPCCDTEWVGGASKCRPFCWQPGALFRGLYGSRFCNGAESSMACDCGGCESCGIASEVYADEGYYSEGVMTSGASGCSTCQTGNCARCRSAVTTGGTRIVHRPAVDPVTRSAARRMDPDVQRIRR